MSRRLQLPAAIEIGAGALEKLPNMLADLSVIRAFVLLDSGLAWLDETDSPIHCDRTLLTQIAPVGEPTTEQADDLAEIARSLQCDGVVAIGGGSVMDLGKAIAVLVANAENAASCQGKDLLQDRGLPVLCVPTTAGSGAEATRSAVLINSETRVKRGINASEVLPDAVILDPNLLSSLPDAPRVAALLDATAHAVESFIGNSAWVMSDISARQAFPLLGKHLRVGSRQLDPFELQDALIGSFFAGVAICSSETGAAHALAYPLSEFFGIAHGRAVAFVLPSVLLHQRSSCESRLREASAAMGFASVNDFLTCLAELRDTLELESQVIGLLNVEHELERVVARALTLQGALANSPMDWSADDFRRVLGQLLSSESRYS